ncbi:MAG TPA: helix-turn-helix domain-containing protein, partial [Gemmatimonadales bacterium]|nr:helix-turn-helix domain-containing protein [Gemmatimonadales bacterium]
AGMTRFTDFQKSLGLAPNVLAARLEHFIAEGLMNALPGPTGHAEYHLTKKGLDFKPVLIALSEWGDRWDAPDGPPIVYLHDQCGGHVGSRLECDRCTKTPTPKTVSARRTAASPAAPARRRTRPLGSRRESSTRIQP